VDQVKLIANIKVTLTRFTDQANLTLSTVDDE